MAFHIVRNDISKMKVDIIVNTANPNPVIGSGVDSVIHHAAGPKLIEERRKIGKIHVGTAMLTDAYDLDAKHVIHTVGPVWEGGTCKEQELLHNCYANALELALKQNCESIAFPLISSGNYGFPKGVALQTAISSISSFLMEHEMEVYLVVFDKTSYTLSEKLFSAVAAYIDENYVVELHQTSYYADEDYRERRSLRRFLHSEAFRCESLEDAPLPAGSAVSQSVEKKRSLQDLLNHVDESFSTHLLRLIDDRGLKDSYVYKKANIDRKHFNKIKNNKNYKPSKETAIAFAIALELSLDETKDLLGRAGYALSHSSMFDIIIEYHISNGIYDIFEIEAVLFHFTHSTLSS